MGAGASAATPRSSAAASIAAASDADLRAVLAALSAEDKAKVASVLKKLPAQYTPASTQPLKEVQADRSQTCVARVQASLDAIAKHDGFLNTCVEVLTVSAMNMAAEADAKLAAGGARRVLEGVPFLVKANIDVASSLSTAAMPGLAEWRPETTAPVVTKLIEAGAIPVAKTTLPEAAFGMWGWSSLHGLTKNPHNQGYTSGGSSTGSAVGLAAGFASAALGSDTEGSLRGPADFAGVVGMRVTMGRYSDEGIVPCNIKHDTVGPMATTVADLAVMDAVITGASPADYTPTDLKGLTVAIPPDLTADLAPGNAKAIALAKEALTKAGAAVKEDAAEFAPLTAPPEGCSICQELSFRQEGFEAYLKSHPNCTLKGKEVIEKSFYPNVKTFFLAPKGRNASGAFDLTNMSTKTGNEYKELKDKYDAARAEWLKRFEAYFDDNQVDVILTPTTNGLPALVETDEGYKDFIACIMKALASYKPIHGLNHLPIPSIAVPTAARHEDPKGGPPMPVGVCLWGRSSGDKKLIEAAMAFEVALKA